MSDLINAETRAVPQRTLRPTGDMKIVITFKDGKWHYEFTGRMTALQIRKVAKGLHRGWARSKRRGMDMEKLHRRREAPPRRIPRERPGENLGADPTPIRPGRPEGRPAPTMPLASGIRLRPTHGPIVEPDAASMQPHSVKPKKEEGNDREGQSPESRE